MSELIEKEKQIQQSLGLMRSMIQSGESFTDSSFERYSGALENVAYLARQAQAGAKAMERLRTLEDQCHQIVVGTTECRGVDCAGCRAGQIKQTVVQALSECEKILGGTEQ